jgi:hypothetical protein
MSPTMRKKLERNIAYHAAMAEYHGEEFKNKHKEEEPKEGAREGHRENQHPRARPTASAQPPKPDTDQYLHELHAGVVAQLQPLLDAEPLTPAIVTASQNQPVSRNLSGDLKPSAGRFH